MESVFPALERMGVEYSFSANLIMGVAKFLSGRPTEALPHLEKGGLDSATSQSRRAATAFYLGESYSALGRKQEAIEAYQRSREVLPNGKFGMQALERLNQIDNKPG